MKHVLLFVYRTLFVPLGLLLSLSLGNLFIAKILEGLRASAWFGWSSPSVGPSVGSATMRRGRRFPFLSTSNSTAAPGDTLLLRRCSASGAARHEPAINPQQDVSGAARPARSCFREIPRPPAPGRKEGAVRWPGLRSDSRARNAGRPPPAVLAGPWSLLLPPGVAESSASSLSGAGIPLDSVPRRNLPLRTSQGT